MANLINAGILPLTFADPGDYDALAQGGKLTLQNIQSGMAAGKIKVTDETGRSFTALCDLSARQQAILMAGGLLNYTREGGL